MKCELCDNPAEGIANVNEHRYRVCLPCDRRITLLVDDHIAKIIETITFWMAKYHEDRADKTGR